MQRAVLNCPPCEWRKTTQVSSRVTADDVNLERIHYSFRKVCTLVASSSEQIGGESHEKENYGDQ
jgi:hypothetical protein